MATLIVISPNLRVREYAIESVVTIGRHESNVIEITEEKASRFHCRIVQKDGQQFLEDLDSANGVSVNGTKIKAQALEHNDRISIGATTIVFSEGQTYQEHPETRDLVSSVSSAALAIVPEPGTPPERPKRRALRNPTGFFQTCAGQFLIFVGFFALLTVLGVAGFQALKGNTTEHAVEPIQPVDQPTIKPVPKPVVENQYVYNFKNWQQQTDWEALSGSWITENEQYVLQTAEGGETRLKPEKLGGAFALRHARLSFDVTVRSPAEGWTFICDLGGARQGLSVVLDAGGVRLEDKSGAHSERLALQAGSVHVEVTIEEKEATLRLNGEPSHTETLANPASASAEGTLSFQAHLCGCALDNIVLKHAD